MRLLLLLFLFLSLSGARSWGRWSGEESWDEDDEPSAGFWVVVGVAGAVVILLIALLIWYFCCPTQTAVTGTPSGGAYSAVLQPMAPTYTFTPGGTPLTTTKRE